MKRDVLSITDLSREEIYELLESAADLKKKRKDRRTYRVPEAQKPWNDF